MPMTGLKRTPTDKFYTITSVANDCLSIVKETLDITPTDLCIEPSAGNGAFITGIKSIFNHYKFYDLEPMHPDIIKQDYLSYDFQRDNVNKIHIIGNPPFGRQSTLAIKFIKKSSEFCDSISFILPKSFKKDSLKKTFPLYFHLITEIDIPLNSFVVDGNIYNVPCIFQIWVKKDTQRTIPSTITPLNYKFVKKNISHDISVRRVGVNAGKINKNTANLSIQSHYFIKFDIKLNDDLFNKLSNINYINKENTVGPKSISKPELIREFNDIMENL